MKIFTLAFLKQLFVVIVTFLLPIKGIIVVVGLSILVDTVTGIIKSKKLNEPITSRRMSNIVSKMVLYQSAVILFFCIEKYILGDIVSLFISTELIVTKLVAITLVSIELKSINENVKAYTGYSLWQRFKDLLIRAKEIKDDIEEVQKDKE